MNRPLAPPRDAVALAVTELLVWRVGTQSTSFKDATFFDAATKTDAAGLGEIEAFSSQKVSADIAKIGLRRLVSSREFSGPRRMSLPSAISRRRRESDRGID